MLGYLGVAPTRAPTTVVSCIADFLLSRSTRIRVGDSLSTPVPVPCGVPQVSLLPAAEASVPERF